MGLRYCCGHRQCIGVFAEEIHLGGREHLGYNAVCAEMNVFVLLPKSTRVLCVFSGVRTSPGTVFTREKDAHCPPSFLYRDSGCVPHVREIG